jgi:SAM-dependent methyltransferase
MLLDGFRRSRSRKLPAQQAYAIWADSYPPRPHNPLMEAEQATVEAILAPLSSRRALDVGTGSGRNLPLLASTGARLVSGVDFSMPMLAKHTSGHPRACGNACALPFRDAVFDLIASSLMMGDISDLAHCIAEIARVLAPGGHLVYSDFHPLWAAGNGRRTFEAPDGRSFELAYCPHTIPAHLAHLDRHGLDVLAVHEAHVPQQEVPVVAVFHAVKRP